MPPLLAAFCRNAESEPEAYLIAPLNLTPGLLSRFRRFQLFERFQILEIFAKLAPPGFVFR